MNNFSFLVTRVGGIIPLTVLAVWLIANRYRVARPNEACIVTGQKGKVVTNPGTGSVSTDLSGQKATMGGGVFVIPLIQRLYMPDLSSRRIMVQIRNIASGQGIKPNLDGIAIVKVGGNEDSIQAVVQCFLMQQEEIGTFTRETLVGMLRSIVGGLSVEQITRDRVAFAQWVADESEVSLTGRGLVLGTFQIQDTTDDGTYLSNLGYPGSAKVGQVATIAGANAHREAEQTRLAVEQEIVISGRELMLKEVEIKVETDVVRAQTATAGPLARADRDQAILTEQEGVAVRQAALKDHQLGTEVREPADAGRYEAETATQGRRSSETFEARTRKTAVIANVEAQAETACLIGEGKKQRRAALAEAEAIGGARRGEVEKARRITEVDAICAGGETRAITALTTGTAEAEAMNKRVAAFVNCSEAVVLQMLTEVLPQVVEKVAAPTGSVDKPTVVSTEGMAALLCQINDNVLQTAEMVKNTTGIDLFDTLKGHTSGKVLGDGTAG